MATFFRPHYHHHQEPNFQGLFRLIDDWDRYTGQAVGGTGRQSRNVIQSFTPKFDFRESESAYELHGELPGISKEDVHLEFTDPQTLQIRGKVERTYTAGTPPAGLIDTKPDEMGGEEHSETASHKATVEDDPEESGATSNTTPQDTPATTVAETSKAAPAQQLPRPAGPQHKYYLVERNVGQFSRAFSFPTRVDNDSVQACLNNGILTVTVQKAKKHESRRIAIN